MKQLNSYLNQINILISALMLIFAVSVTQPAYSQTTEFQTLQSLSTDWAWGWEAFTISGTSYLIAANGKGESKLYKWNGTDFTEFRTIPTGNCRSWTFFAFNNGSYLAAANAEDGASVYRWSGTDFEKIQSISGNSYGCEFFSIGKDTYLAVANVSKNGSKIYEWNGSAFEEFQTLNTMGAFDCEFFTIGTESYLAVADALIIPDALISPKIYKWDNTQFREFQNFSFIGATDWEFFSIGDIPYLAVANMSDGDTYNTNSNIYKWSGTAFELFQSVPTSGATSWAFLDVGSNHYLAAANWYDGSDYKINSVIYKWNGTQFAAFQSVPTHGARDWKAFRIGNKFCIAVANSGDETILLTDSAIYFTSNDPPSASGGTFSVDENSPDGTVIGAVSASDPDADTLSYEIISGDAEKVFAIDGAGEIKVNNSSKLDYEASAVYTLTVRVSDGTGDKTVFVTINIKDVNEPPEISDQNFSVNENSAAGTAVGKVSARDPESLPLTYSITGGNTNTAFAVASSTGQITVSNANALNYEVLSSYVLTVKVSDGKNMPTARITIAVSNVNESPTVKNQSFSVNENSAKGAYIGVVSASDPDSNALTYSITAGNTGNAFAISGSGQITVNDSSFLDYESVKTYSLTVQVSDGGYSPTATVSITIKNVNEKPVAANQSFSVNENSPKGTAVGTVSASDPENAMLTYKITAGNTDSIFAISSSTGQITVNDGTRLDYEIKNTYPLTVQISDGTSATIITVTVTVNDVNENPAVSNQSFSVNENSPEGTVVGTVVASDPDTTLLTYSILSGNTDNAFALNSSTRQITVANASVLDYEKIKTPYILTVQVSDGTYNGTAQITITVKDVNESPVVKDQTFSVAERSPQEYIVGKVSASDPESAKVSYEIVSGNENKAFALNKDSGEITVADSAKLNYEIATDYALIIRVSDGINSATATVTVTVLYVNESPFLKGENQIFSVDENSAVGTAVGTVSADDPNKDALTYEITAGNESSRFAISKDTGKITVAALGLDYETISEYKLTVQISDGTYSYAGIVTVNVNDIDEIPEIKAQTFSVDEDAANGELAATVSVHNPDRDALIFEIISGNTNTVFAIGKNTGDITVKDRSQLNYKLTAAYTLLVKVSDGVNSVDAVITITVNNIVLPGDINDDSLIDLPDAVLGLQVTTGISPSAVIYLLADVNGDGKIGIAEVIYVLIQLSEP